MEPERVWTDEALLLEAERLARRYARAGVPAELADDVSQDVVLGVLVDLRANPRGMTSGELTRLIRSMVRSRRLDQLRGERRRRAREARYARSSYRPNPAWMSPDQVFDDLELEQFHQQTLEYLAPACRQAYLMVREGCSTYQAAAEALGVSPCTIRVHVFTARREFRRGLEALGISTAGRKQRRPRRAA